MVRIVIKIWRFAFQAGFAGLLAVAMPCGLAPVHPRAGGRVAGAARAILPAVARWDWLSTARVEASQSRDGGAEAEAPETHGRPDALGTMGLYSVTTFGADPHGRRDSTPAIQRAVDAACAAAGLGGAKPTVFFPAGTYNVFSGPVIDSCRS
ncbi:MAG: glycosyl hydrolase family 28-related protein, partial [Candidatus Binataceae bacterium]